MRGFRRRRQSVVAEFGPDEAELLHVLVADLLALLASEDPRRGDDADTDDTGGSAGDPDPLVALTGMTGTARDPGPPEDPVLARLFPDAYRLDVDPAQSEFAADYRRFTTGALHEQKEAGLRLMQSTLPAPGGPVVLDEAAADAWMTALTDLRLALGTRIGVTEELAEQVAAQPLPPDDPRGPALEVFDFLGWLQETLVRAVAGW